MTLSAAQMPAGYEQSIQEIREKLERRITNASQRLDATPTYHRGTADPENLPEGQLHIWCDWEDEYPNDGGEAFQAESLVSVWHIQIITEDEGNDAFGSESQLGEIVWGKILRTLTESTDDLGLSGTVDYLTTSSRKVAGFSSGSRKVTLHEITVQAFHQMEWVRMAALLSVES